jgi:hypothetical protein
MKIIYCCFGGSHSSVTAAAIHLGMLSSTRIPSRQELLNIPFFERQTAKDHGLFRFMGCDELGREVYIVGKHNLGKNFERIIRQVASLFALNQQELVIIDSMPYVNFIMMVGGYISRRLGIIFIGRPIVSFGTQKAFLTMAGMVNRVKIKLAARSQEESL